MGSTYIPLVYAKFLPLPMPRICYTKAMPDTPSQSIQSTPNTGTPPAFADITLYDQETGEPFIFSAKEQEFYWRQGFTNVPKYTPERRKLKREQRLAGKDVFNVRCYSCGKVGRIMQEPANYKQVLCENCFTKKWEEYLDKHPDLKAEHEKAAAEAAALQADYAEKLRLLGFTPPDAQEFS
jgi:hypothetical protein